MNRPERYEAYVLDVMDEKVTYTKDTKMTNAGTFTFKKEDHTLGNLIRDELLRDKSVLFAGYKVPHPLRYDLVIKVRTQGDKDPMQAMCDAIKNIRQKLRNFEKTFEKKIMQ